MQIVCQSCSSRIQLDDAKLPSHAFSVRCPKCQQAINVQPPAAVNGAAHGNNNNNGAAAAAQQQSTTREQTSEAEQNDGADEAASGPERSRFAAQTAAPLFRAAASADSAAATPDDARPSADVSELVQALAALLGDRGALPGQSSHRRRRPSHLKTLICVTEAHRHNAAEALADHGHEVYVAADAMQALERMRQEPMDVVMFDSEFDSKGQGSVFIAREIIAMRPVVRRQTFVVHLTLASRLSSGDAHAAFLHNTNMVVHPDDLAAFPQVLDGVMRDYDDLYEAFRAALDKVD